MSIYDIITASGGAMLILITLIQISPIKLNPWSALGKAVGKVINGEVLERVNTLDKAIISLKAELAENLAIDCRTRILRFGDEVLHGTKHTKDHFEEILRDIKKYNLYCKQHPEFENNVTELTSSRIKDIYKKCLENNDFL